MGKELKQIVDKICAEYSDVLLEKCKREKEGKKTEIVYFPVMMRVHIYHECHMI